MSSTASTPLRRAAPALPAAECRAYKHGDTSTPSCTKFCTQDAGAVHCRWCKCQACSFCTAQQSHRQSRSPSGLGVEQASPPRTQRAYQGHADSGSGERAVVILSGHQGTNASWARFAPHRVVVLDKTDIPNIGFDATTYLWWIIRNYDALPSWCLFMHNHEYHWHHPFYSQLVSMVIDVETLGRGYLNIAHDREGRMQVYEKGALAELNVTENEQLRRELLGLHTPYRGSVRYAPGGQFWVSRARIRGRPLEFYKRLFEAMADGDHPLLGRSSPRYPGRQLHVFFLEAYWHHVLGEPENYTAPVSRYDELPRVQASMHTLTSLAARKRAGPGGLDLEKRYPCDLPHQWNRCAARSERQRRSPEIA